MLMVIPDEGKLKWLKWMINDDGTSFCDLILHLYQNDYTPVDGSDISSFLESTFTGYTPVTITRAEMGAIALAGHVAYATRSAAPEFTCTGGSAQDCWGWYLTSDDADDTVMAAQRFDAKRTMGAGATESIDPFKIGLKTFA